MKQKQLDRIIRLVKRTGDRFVILDRDTDEAMVVMNLDEYEDLLNTTTEVENLAEEEMLSRLNHDINRWQEQNEKRATLPQIQYEEPELETDQEYEEPQKLPELGNLSNFSQENEDLEDSELEDSIEFEPNSKPIAQQSEETATYLTPAIQELPLEMTPNANFAEEDLSDLPEGEEEKFYLEPIE